MIDPEGYIALVAPGEVSVDTMADALREIERRSSERGTLVRGPDPTAPRLQRHEGTLRFPTRAIVAADRLWVADTGHGRILECSWTPAENTATILAEYSGFAEPRGLAELGGSIYVADRAGHSIWRLGRSGGEVAGSGGTGGEAADGDRDSANGAERVRVAGTGVMGERAVTPGPALASELRSPWGLAAHGTRLAIAMAGSHQIWELDPASGWLSLLAGRGAEDIYDGPSLEAALAQPTGLASLGDGSLAVADCETSAVRIASATDVRTVVGTGLFKFGDKSGVGDEALMEHCEDVAALGGALAVADTYNDRLKRVDPVTRSCEPWSGEAGEKGALREPGGVFGGGDHLLVADTGNHRIVAVAEDGSVAEIHFE